MASPDLRTIITMTAQNLGRAVSDEWISAVIAEAPQGGHATLIDYLQHRFETFELADIMQTIERRRAELRQLNARRRELLAAQAPH